MRLKKRLLSEKVINWILNVLIVVFGIVFLFSIYNGFQTKVLGKKYVDFFGLSVFEVQTGSMADTINPGDWILIKMTNDIHLNDIITYELGEEYITHRVIGLYNDTYITKGDANNVKDDVVNKTQVLGKLVTVLGNFGLVRNILFNPGTLIVLIVTLYLFNYAFNKNKKQSAFVSRLFKKTSLIYNNIKKKIGDLKNESKDTEKSEVESPLFELNEVKAPVIEKINVDAVDKKIYDFSEFNEDDSEVEDDLEKTMMFRMISVDTSELDDTFVEIAQNEIKEAERKKQENEIEESAGEEDSIVDSGVKETKINLNLLKDQKSKKGKNIIDTVILYKIEEFTELIEILIENKSYLSNKKIKNSFMTSYIDAKYYNYFGEEQTEQGGKNTLSKLEKSIKELAKNLVVEYEGKKEENLKIIEAYKTVFLLISNFEYANTSINDVKVKRKFYKKQLLKYYKSWNNEASEKCIDKALKVQRNYIGIVEYFLKKLETSMFDLKFNKLNKKNIYALDLKHNINFSKVYSEYIIDKTYTEGSIAENKVPVMMTLFMSQLIKDMLENNFDRKYILKLPDSLYKKMKKTERFLKMMDDKHAKEYTYILLTYDVFLENKKFIKELKKSGFKFALTFNKQPVIKESQKGDFYIAEHIFINNKVVNALEILAALPEELVDAVIYEDIISKIGELESE